MRRYYQISKMYQKSKVVALRFAAALSALAFITACNSDSPETLLASAKSYLEKNDSKAAMIQIKTALQANPNIPEARYLLGITLLEGGNASQAEVELRKALALKFSQDIVLPKIAIALLAQGQDRKLIEELAGAVLSTPQARADLQASLARAYSQIGNVQAAEGALNAAMADVPNYPRALLLLARQRAVSGDYNGALALVDQVVKGNASDAEAWKFQGDILQFGRRSPDDALAAYRKAVSVRSDYLPARLSILSMLLTKGDFSTAKAEIEQLKKISPTNSQTKFAQLQYAYLTKDLNTAFALSQQLLKLGPDNPIILQMAGAVELQRADFLQAETHLARSLQLAPKVTATRQLLATAYLRQGQADRALATLMPAQIAGDFPSELFSLVGEVYLQNGDATRAEDYFSKALKLDPSDAGKRTTLALTRLIRGDATSAFSELDAVASQDKGVTADMALISAYLQRKEFDKALLAVDGLEQKQPNQPLASQLRGRINLLRKEPEEARRSFERALSASPGYIPALEGLAALDLADNKSEEAKKRFDKVLATEPNNGRALMALAQISLKSRAPASEVATLLSRAVSADPSNPVPRRLLVELYLKTADLQQALAAIQNALSVIPDNPDLLNDLGRVQLARGELNQARGTYGRLSNLLPSDPTPYLRLAEVEMAAKNSTGAEHSFHKALYLKPDLIDAQLGLVLINTSLGKYPDALSIAKTVQKQRPSEPAGYAMEGEIYIAQKDWDAAAAAYRAGLSKSESPQLAAKLHGLLVASGKTADAEKFSNIWTKTHPRDVLFLFHLGDVALNKKDYIRAEKSYSAIREVQPNNAAVFNNLAWIAMQTGKGNALDYAKRANEIAPNQPAFMDTMAMILAESRDYQKAIDLQKRVVALRPDESQFKLNLAKIYAKSGDKRHAKEELETLSRLGDKFASQSEVSSLLKGL